MTTTIAAVCRRMVEEVEDLVPATLATVTFTHWKGHERPLRTQARLGNVDMVRHFSILPVGDQQGPDVTNGDEEWVEETVEVVVAYARKSASRWGSTPALDMVAAIEQDMKQIYAAIGPSGYQTLDLSLGGDAVVIGGEDSAPWSREEEEQVVFGVLRMRVAFARSM